MHCQYHPQQIQAVIVSTQLCPSAAACHSVHALKLLGFAARRWVNGTHYSRTLEAWLRHQDANRRAVLRIFAATYGQEAALKWFVYWRLFYLACSELFNFNEGEEWGVG